MKKESLPLSEATANTILDGRNRKDVAEISPYVSEFALAQGRMTIEGLYLIAQSRASMIRPFTKTETTWLTRLGVDMTLSDFDEMKDIEEKITHDVRATEATIKNKIEREQPSLMDVVENTHALITSEDPSNLAYRTMLREVTKDVFIPFFDKTIDTVVAAAQKTKGVPSLARTHGQRAVPTTIGRHLSVFAVRLAEEVTELEQLVDKGLKGKFSGIVGNMNAAVFTYPEIDWLKFATDFVESLDFNPTFATTQINTYEDMIKVFQTYIRINGVMTDFTQNTWMYASDGRFGQEAPKVQGADSSSASPRKINPWRGENGEGNIGKGTALFEFMARQLPLSRDHRHIADSTIIRDMGAPLGWSLLGYKNVLNQFQRFIPNEEVIHADLYRDWTILSEAAQNLLRKLRVPDPYETVSKLTQGLEMEDEEWRREVVSALPIDDPKAKQRLMDLEPNTYLGLAIELADWDLAKVKDLRSKGKKGK